MGLEEGPMNVQLVYPCPQYLLFNKQPSQQSNFFTEALSL